MKRDELENELENWKTKRIEFDDFKLEIFF